MKKLSVNIFAVIIITTSIILLSRCSKHENPVRYENGTFPDTVVNLKQLNSVYDDYNVTFYQVYGNVPLVFSSNRGSNGGQFDLVQGVISYLFDKTTGEFGLGAEIWDNEFLDKLISSVNTPGNDLGPYRLYSPFDGKEYLFLSSVNSEGNLDLVFTMNTPEFGYPLPDIQGPFPVTLLNTGSEEAYLCFDASEDSLYFCSDAGGNFDIMVHSRPSETSISEWLRGDYEASGKVDALNSAADDKCPLIYKNVMVFASNRPGEIGGFDLYYSVFKNGQWNAPVNMGPKINTEYDEYRPVIGGQEEFTNIFMVFSSNRSGGSGGFDLYYAGLELPE